MAIKEDTKNKLEESTNTWDYDCVRDWRIFPWLYGARGLWNRKEKKKYWVPKRGFSLSSLTIAGYELKKTRKKYLESIETQFNDLSNWKVKGSNRRLRNEVKKKFENLMLEE